MKKALIVVDVQKDFCEGGALAVPDADSIVEGINAIRDKFDVVVFTKDWHPADHKSFASNNEGKKPFDMSELNGKPQVMWPDHCVQGEVGALFHTDLKLGAGDIIMQKGTNPEADSYSGFYDNNGSSTKLGQKLRDWEIETVYICGLATDYCVKATALDAVKEGFNVNVIQDLCRAVNMQPNDDRKALREMQNSYAHCLLASDVQSKQEEFNEICYEVARSADWFVDGFREILYNFIGKFSSARDSVPDELYDNFVKMMKELFNPERYYKEDK